MEEIRIVKEKEVRFVTPAAAKVLTKHGWRIEDAKQDASVPEPVAPPKPQMSSEVLSPEEMEALMNEPEHESEEQGEIFPLQADGNAAPDVSDANTGKRKR